VEKEVSINNIETHGILDRKYKFQHWNSYTAIINFLPNQK